MEHRLAQRWCDTGCARGLGGMIQRPALTRVYRPFHVCPVTYRCNDTFQFGNGHAGQATVTKTCPVFVNFIYRGSINQAVVTSYCPIMLSNAVMADWDIDVWTDRNTLTLHKFSVTLPVAEDKVLVVDITDIEITSLRNEWNMALR